MPISAWSTTPASNNSAPPNGAPEGMTPSSVNDIMRQQMADHKTQWLDAAYFNQGDTPSRASAATFKIATDVTATYVKGRRIKCLDSSTLYGTITASSYGAPDTTVTVGLDSGSLTASLSSVALAILSSSNMALPHGINIKGADIASATTTDLSAATGDYVDVTGTTTITGLGTATAGVEKTVRFTGALTLTHNATSLILPSSASITTVNGDTAIFRSLGSGNWKCISYTRQDGTAVVAPVSNPFADSTAIIKGSADATKLLRFEVDGFTTGTTRVITPPNYDLGFFVVNRVSTMTGAVATGTTTIPFDNSKPQNTEGTQFLTLSITPKSTTNVLVIDAWCGIYGASTAAKVILALFQDTTADALAASCMTSDPSTERHTIWTRWIMTAGTTSSTTFNVRAGLNTAGTFTFNGDGGARIFGDAASSGILITEYTA